MDVDAKLFDCTIERRFTDDYLDRWPTHVPVETFHRQKWGISIEGVQAIVNESIRPGQCPYFDAMYTDILTSIKIVPDEEVAARRERLQGLSFASPCCELAVLDSCVCSYRTLCPVHEEICHGSHD